MVPIIDIDAAIERIISPSEAYAARIEAAEAHMQRSREEWLLEVQRQYARGVAASAEFRSQLQQYRLNIQDGWGNVPPVDNVFGASPLYGASLGGIPPIPAYGAEVPNGTYANTAGTFAGAGGYRATVTGGIADNYAYYNALAERQPRNFGHGAATATGARAAQEKAEKLLMDTVPVDEYRNLVEPAFRENQYIQVTGKAWIYRIRRNKQTLVCCDKGPHGTACLQLTDGSAPDQDRMVAEYILLKNNEPYYLQTANINWAGH